MHASKPIFTLRCLGSPQFETSTGLQVKLETRKALALLVYLRLNGRDFTREFLASLFWPEYDQQRALANLRRTLASFNNEISAGLISADRQNVGLHDPLGIWSDVEAFELELSAVETHDHRKDETCPTCLAALETAVGLYHSDFLEGFNLKDSPAFDDWQLVYRQELQRRMGWALQKAAEFYAAGAQWEAALTYARRRVSFDPLDETAQRLCISIYLRLGQRGAARRQVEELRELLGQELSAETQALYAQAVAAPLSANFSEDAGERLLLSKLYIPSTRARQVRRARLLEALDQVENKSLTLISAPAGFGKTTLLAEWAARTHLAVGWLSLDGGDNTPQRFLAYLAAAVESLQDGLGEGVRRMLDAAQPPPQAVLNTLLGDLERAAQPFVLIIDDYQFVTSQTVHDIVLTMLDRRPRPLHLVLASRVDPPLPLARLRSQDQLLELRARDLRFTSSEAAEFLNQSMGLDLAPPDVETLANRTEGWIVGLQMAALSLKGKENASAFIQAFSGSNRYILDYLMEEVLNHQPETMQRFLMETSILDRLNAPLCNAVTGRTDGQAALEALEKSNLFLTPLDDERQWYRYHHLFADLLRARLEQALPGAAARLQIQASQWFEQQGWIDEAVSYAYAAGDFDRMARVIQQNSLSLSQQFKAPLLARWIQLLPPEMIIEKPKFAMFCAFGLISHSQTEQAIPYLDAAEQQIPTLDLDAGETRSGLGWVAGLRTQVAEARGDFPWAIQQANLALHLLEPQQFAMRVSTKYILGRVYYSLGDFERARSLWDETLHTEIEIRPAPHLALSFTSLARLERVQGRLDQAESICRQAIRMIEADGCSQFYVSGLPYAILADVLCDRNQLEQAEQMARESLRQNQQWDNLKTMVTGLNTLARIQTAQGNMEGALATLAEDRQTLQKCASFLDIRSDWLRAQVMFLIRKGDLMVAQETVEEYQRRFSTTAVLWQEYDQLTLCWLLLAQGRRSEVLDILARWLPLAETGGRFGRVTEMLALKAVALEGLGRRALAQEALKKCLRLAQPGSCTRLFLDLGEPQQRLV